LPCRNIPFYHQSIQYVAEWVALPHNPLSTFYVLSCFSVQALGWSWRKEKEQGSEANNYY
jgi:hypothetical protein